MKRLIAAATILTMVGVAFGLDNEAWLAKARECADGGFMMDSDETKEDGVYCLVLAVINTSSASSADAQVGQAVLDAKKKITAFVKGETVSASTSLESRSVETSNNGEKVRQSYKKFEKKIKTKVDALVKGIKVVGQVTVKEKK